MKLVGTIFLAILITSVFSILSVPYTYSANTPKAVIQGRVLLRYRGKLWGWAWAQVHFVNEQGEEFTAYSNYGGIYWIRVPSGEYAVHASIGWYSGVPVNATFDGGRTQYNLYINITS